MFKLVFCFVFLIRLIRLFTGVLQLSLKLLSCHCASDKCSCAPRVCTPTGGRTLSVYMHASERSQQQRKIQSINSYSLPGLHETPNTSLCNNFSSCLESGIPQISSSKRLSILCWLSTSSGCQRSKNNSNQCLKVILTIILALTSRQKHCCAEQQR